MAKISNGANNLKRNVPRPKMGPKVPKKGPPGDPERKRLIALFLVPLSIFILLQIFVFPNFELKELNYSEFYRILMRNPEAGEIIS